MRKMILLIKRDTWVFPYLRSYKKLLALIIFLGFMTTFSGAALMFTSGFLISRSAQIPENILMVYVPIVLTRAFGIGRPSFRYAERLVSHNWVLKIVSTFRRRLYELVETGTKSVYAKTQTGEVLNVLANDLFKIENFYLRTLFPTVIGLVIYVLIAIGVGVFDWGFALAIFLILGMTTILAPMITLAVNGARDFKQQQLEAELYTDLTDTVMGLQDWILAGRTAELAERQQADFNAINQLKSKQAHFNWWRDFSGAMIIGFTAIVLLVFATRHFGGSSFGVNWIAAFVLAIFPAEDALTSISTGVGEWPRYQNSITPLMRVPKNFAVLLNHRLFQRNDNLLQITPAPQGSCYMPPHYNPYCGPLGRHTGSSYHHLKYQLLILVKIQDSYFFSLRFVTLINIILI
jgi:ATP-binding cassette, subfamily C, bacterial CydC